MTKNQIINQRDELMSLTKNIIKYLDELGEEFSDQTIMEEAESFKDKLADLIELDAQSSSEYD